MGWEDPDPADVLALATDADWQALLDRYDQNLLPRPLERCLEVARANGASTVVVETRYMDLDFRSEYSNFFSTTFAEIPDTAHRLHFFAAVIDPADLANLSEQVLKSYVGFVTVRPSPLGRVGRTMLRPPPDLAGSVHALVDDRVSLFGQDLLVSAVPFAQQDTQFGRCAHVAAWICHYTAFLRGDVPRRAMADFSLLADANVAEGRPLPSQGLTGLQLSNLLRELGLPPILYRLGAIPGSGREPPVPAHGPDDDPGTWDTRVVAVICRFLNSRYPVLIGNRDHAFVLVGYRRETKGGTPWIGFVRHDDQRGPYLLVDDILHDVDPATGYRYTPWQLVLAPVPAKLWLLPEAAERVGSNLLECYGQLEGAKTFDALAAVGRLTFRTFAIASSAFKQAAGLRGLDPNAVRELRLARMSRMVWVVEAIDRDLRAAGQPCVLGEAVFDCTSSDHSPNILALRVPGALLIKQTDGTIRSPLLSTVDAVSSSAQFQP